MNINPVNTAQNYYTPYANMAVSNIGDNNQINVPSNTNSFFQNNLYNSLPLNYQAQPLQGLPAVTAGLPYQGQPLQGLPAVTAGLPYQGQPLQGLPAMTAGTPYQGQPLQGLPTVTTYSNNNTMPTTTFGQPLFA